jgi:anti-sigma B factor antagonist
VDLGLEHECPAENIALIRVVGELDVYTSAKLRRLIIELASAGRQRFVLDLAQVGYIDSTGIGVLVGAFKYCRWRDGYVALVITSKRLAEPFRVSGLSKVFPIFDDPDNGVAALSAEALPAGGFHPDLKHFNWAPYDVAL